MTEHAAERPGLGARIRRRALDAATLAGFVALLPAQALFRRASLVGDRPFFDAAAFPWVPEVEAAWREARAELDQVMGHLDAVPAFQDLSEENRALTDDDRWKTFFFYGWGLPVESNLRRCPRTAALLARIPGMTSAFFSIMLPGKRLPPHRGPWAGVLRYHLGLLVPEPGRCGIRVGAETGQWSEGASLIFDDTYEHEAWNEGGTARVVLFVDVLRPLPGPLDALNRGVVRLIQRSSLVKPAFEKFRAWDARLAKVWKP